MKAVGLTRYLPITEPDAFLDLELPMPQPGPRDLLVKVEAIAVNPLDTKERAPRDKVEDPPRVLGWDAAGTVEAVGSAVTLFKPGDRVYYAGDKNRPGSNSQWQAVDERIVGRMPASLDFIQAAALPLTTITAWEALFDRLHVARTAPANGATEQSLLVIGGAGGVGSLAIQLAVKLAGLKVIATASRPESAAWCRELGAAATVNHFDDMPAQIKALGMRYVDHVLILNDFDRHFPAAAKLVAPQGGICSIVRPMKPVDMSPMIGRSSMLSFEFMFTRPTYNTSDMIEQHRLLTEVGRLVDNGTLRTTLNETLTPINAANLKRAHAALEAGRTIGKIVLHGWGG